jgi:UDP-glucose 4-epimerase
MKILVTGSAGHLGEALMRTLQGGEHQAIGLDCAASPFTSLQCSIGDAAAVNAAMRGIDVVLHTATLHKPHVATHSPQAFIETNISGTLNLLEAALRHRVQSFVMTSSTSVFGDALIPPAAAPAAWITEDVVAIPKNIYGVTKAAAEDLCQLFHRNHGLPCVVLRASRFFPEQDDAPDARAAFSAENLKTTEYLHRRVAIEDVVSAHLCALARAKAIGFGKFIISATTPFLPSDMAQLRLDAAAVLAKRVPEYASEYARHNWQMPQSLDRVYVNSKALNALHWQPRYDFRSVLELLRTGQSIAGPLAQLIGVKGYHPSAAHKHL